MRDSSVGSPFDLQNLLESINDVQIALGFKFADVARVEPAFVVEGFRRRSWIVEVRDRTEVGAVGPIIMSLSCAG